MLNIHHQYSLHFFPQMKIQMKLKQSSHSHESDI